MPDRQVAACFCDESGSTWSVWLVRPQQQLYKKFPEGNPDFLLQVMATCFGLVVSRVLLLFFVEAKKIISSTNQHTLFDQKEIAKNVKL